jgi:hypothetical protein
MDDIAQTVQVGINSQFLFGLLNGIDYSEAKTRIAVDFNVYQWVFV